MRVNWRIAAIAATIGSVGVVATQALAERETPDLTGVWSGSLTSQDSDYWTVQDHFCFMGCPETFHETLGAQIADPANAEAPLDPMLGAAIEAMSAERAAISTAEGQARLEEVTTQQNISMESYCDPYGFVREAMNALPMRIREDGGNLVIDYEEFSQTRTIHMGADAEPPADLQPTRLGWSKGRFEGDALIVETVGIAEDEFISIWSPTNYWGSFADGATAVERYELKDNPRRLELTLTLTDPVTLTRPYVWTKTWLAAPDMTLVQDSCSDIPGQMDEAAT